MDIIVAGVALDMLIGILLLAAIDLSAKRHGVDKRKRRKSDASIIVIDRR